MQQECFSFFPFYNTIPSLNLEERSLMNSEILEKNLNENKDIFKYADALFIYQDIEKDEFERKEVKKAINTNKKILEENLKQYGYSLETFDDYTNVNEFDNKVCYQFFFFKNNPRCVSYADLAKVDYNNPEVYLRLLKELRTYKENKQSFGIRVIVEDKNLKNKSKIEAIKDVKNLVNNLKKDLEMEKDEILILKSYKDKKETVFISFK